MFFPSFFCVSIKAVLKPLLPFSGKIPQETNKITIIFSTTHSPQCMYVARQILVHPYIRVWFRFLHTRIQCIFHSVPLPLFKSENIITVYPYEVEFSALLLNATLHHVPGLTNYPMLRLLSWLPPPLPASSFSIYAMSLLSSNHVRRCTHVVQSFATALPIDDDKRICLWQGCLCWQPLSDLGRVALVAVWKSQHGHELLLCHRLSAQHSLHILEKQH